MSYVPLEDSNFNVAEQVNILFKSAMGFPSTLESKPWFQETAIKYNNYINGENIFLDEIPSSPNFNVTINATDVGLTNSNFSTGGGIKEDSTGTIRYYKRLKLTAISGSNNNAYYLTDSSGNNILADGLQFNTKWSGSGDKPYPYQLSSQSRIVADPDAPDIILQNSSGGNWFYDIKNGVIFFPDYLPSIVNNTTNPPVFSFYKYVGRKGISKLIEINASAPTNPITNQIFLNTTDKKLQLYNGSSWDDYGGSGGGSGTITDKIAINTNGNVGIGCAASATDRLTVQGLTRLECANNKVMMELGAENGSTLITATNINGTSGEFRMFDLGHTKVRFTSKLNNVNFINNGGNVGIGTTNPSVPLEVSSDTNTQFLVKTASDDSNDSNIEIRGARNGMTTGEQASITLSNYDNSTGMEETHILGKISGRVSNHTDNVGDLILQSSDDGSTLSDVITLIGKARNDSGSQPLPKRSIAFNVGRSATDRVFFENNDNDNQDGVGLTLRTEENPVNGCIFSVRSSGQAPRFWVGQEQTNCGVNHFYFGKSSGNDTSYDTSTFSGVLKNDGSVGIGTTNPHKKCHVDGGELIVTGSSNDWQTEVKKLIFARPNRNSLDRHHYISSQTFSTAKYNFLKFVIDDGSTTDGTSHTETMILRGDGNVGIGTNSPDQILEINGWIGRTAHNNGGLCGSYNNVEANSYKTNPIYVIGNHYKPNDADLKFMYGIGYTHTNASFITQGSGSGSWGQYVAADGKARIWFGATVGANSYFNSGGNVGIGTDNPQSQLNLHKQYADSGIHNTSGISFTTNSPHSSSKWACGYVGGYIKSNNGTTSGYPGGLVFKTKAADSVADYTFVDRMVIDSNGNVGIGTNNPGTHLHSIMTGNGDSIPDTGINESCHTALGVMGSTPYGLAIGTFQSSGNSWIQAKRFTNGNKFKLLLNPDGGNVGIGTTSPSYLLDLKKSGTDNYIRVQGGATASTYSGIFLSELNNTYGWMIRNNCSTDRLHISHSNSSGTITDKIAINTNGNVGIGWTNPHQKLDVHGNLYVRGDGNPNDNRHAAVYINDTFRGKGASGYGARIVFDNHNSSYHWIILTKENDYHLWFYNGSRYRGFVRQNTSGGNYYEMNDFTGQHRSLVKEKTAEEIITSEGLIVCANNNDYISLEVNENSFEDYNNRGCNKIVTNEALPIVSICTKEKDKSVFGVISTLEDDNREDNYGTYVSVFNKERGDNRAYINSVGEGCIWVTNKNGNLESGDYITSSIIPGYGQLQESEFLANYTVAKITMDCDFTGDEQVPEKRIKNQNLEYIFSKDSVKITDYSLNFETVDDNVTQFFNNINKNEKIQLVHECYTENTKGYIYNIDKNNNSLTIYDADLITKEDKDNNKQIKTLELSEESPLKIIIITNPLDQYGNMQWEDVKDSSGNVIYEDKYKMRYLLPNGNRITKEEYNTKKTNNEEVYIAAFVGCTYHCG